MSILIKNVHFKDTKTNILIEDGKFKAFGVSEETPAQTVIEAEGKAILPSFFNTHTHAAMTLLRGYADDMPLQKWLTEYIWPYEDTLTADDIEKGSRIAAREMVSGGTTFFNDMYFDIERTIKVVEETGMRASIGITVMENHSLAVSEQKRQFVEQWHDPTGGRIQLCIAPHAIYTVGTKKLIESAEWARNAGLKLTIHLSETAQEVADCIRDHGTTPVRYLDSIGFLGPDVIAAHCVHIDEEEWDIMARRGVTVSHCPCSNMKLGSGRFPYELAIRSGVNITLGTDGCSSNNNLDMREEMKFASFLSKCVSAVPAGEGSAAAGGALGSAGGALDSAGCAGTGASADAGGARTGASAAGSAGTKLINCGDPTILPADMVLDWATVNGAKAFGIDAGLAEGKVADCILVDLSDIRMQPNHHLISNWVYAASSDCITTVICNGQVIR